MSDVPDTRNGPGWVVMTHPNLKDKDGKPVYCEVTEEALEVSWTSEGWVKADSGRATKSTQKVGG